MSWHNNSPINFKLGILAMWNLLTKHVVDGTDSTLALLKERAPGYFEDLIQSPRPTAMGDRKQ